MLLRRLVQLVIVAAVGLVLIQLIPYGRSHADPAIVSEPSWNSPQTRQLAMRACGDCHGNQTTWPWYSNVAPISWLVQRDVESGRRHLNFSDWSQPSNQREINRIARAVQNGSMPPVYYTWLHPNAKLTPQEQQQLIDGFNATFGTGSGTSSGEPDALASLVADR